MANKTIWKYPLAVEDYQQIEMPSGAEILHAHMNQGQPCIWALVNDSAPMVLRGFYMHGTGHAVSINAGRYIGTVHMDNTGGGVLSSLFPATLVFHIFEEK